MSHRSMYKHVCVCKCVPFPIKTNNNKNNRADTSDMQRSMVQMLRRILEVDMHTSSVESADLQEVSEGTGSTALSQQGHLFFLTLCMDIHFRFSLNVRGEKRFHTAAHRSCFTFPVEFCSIFPLLLPRKRKRKSHTNK